MRIEIYCGCSQNSVGFVEIDKPTDGQEIAGCGACGFVSYWDAKRGVSVAKNYTPTSCEECSHFCRSECLQDGFDENPWSPDVGLCPYLKK